MYRHKYLLSGFVAATLAVLCMSGAALAQAVTQAYQTDVAIQRGMIVRIAEKDKTKVEPLPADKISDMEGVVVAANDAPVTLSSNDADARQVFVATTGKYNVIVSTQNGSIKEGELITISSLDGVGMAAGTQQSLIIGKAIGSFDGKTGVSGTSKLKGPDGKEITVSLGLVAVDINISRNPREDTKRAQIIPGLTFLQTSANAIAQKDVNPVKVYLGALLLVLSMAIAGSIIYGGIRSSMVSIGRNPLAKSSIMRNLVQIVLVGVIVLIIGVLGVYLILKL